MNFLLDANVPRSVLQVLAQHGHSGTLLADIGLGDAPDDRVATRARAHGAVLVTRDLDFADVRAYPPKDSPGILVLRLPDDWTAGRIVSLVDRFFSTIELVPHIPGHLVILEPHQVRFRPGLQ